MEKFNFDTECNIKTCSIMWSAFSVFRNPFYVCLCLPRLINQGAHGVHILNLKLIQNKEFFHYH